MLSIHYHHHLSGLATKLNLNIANLTSNIQETKGTKVE